MAEPVIVVVGEGVIDEVAVDECIVTGKQIGRAHV